MHQMLTLLVLLALAPGAAHGRAAPRVESFSPEGLAKAVRQVAVRFSAPMVAFGDPRPRVDLFEIDCPEQGVARWVDERSWVYDFPRDLPAGLRCRFVLVPELRSLAGARLGGRREFAFTTGGPAIATTLPWRGAEVAEDQRFVLRLDAVPDEASVHAHAYFRVEGLADPVGVRVVTGSERDESLRLRLRESRPSDLLIEARQRFPAGRRLALVWDRGVATASGVATTEAQTVEYRTRVPLGVEISCPRENARADCLPLGRVELRFSAPIEAAAASRIRLVPVEAPPGEAVRAAEPAYDEGAAYVQFWRIRGPFPSKSLFRLELPPGLRDDAGRSLSPLDASQLEIRVAPLPPLAEFAARIGVIEAAAPVLPVTLRRIEPEALPSGASLALAGEAAGLSSPSAAQTLAWLRATARSRRERSIFAATGVTAAPAERRRFELPRSAGGDATEVVGIPLPGPGLHLVEIESRALGLSLLGADRPLYASALALVTNLSVHFKWGREGSLAWVTSLDRGLPVAGALVTVFGCEAEALASGVSDEDGLVWLGKLLAPDAEAACEGTSTYDSGLLVMARLEADVSFVHTSWERGIEPFRFDVPTRWQPVAALAHTIFDRALFRAGETVHMKHVLRRPVLRGFAQLDAAERPSLLRIQHLGSDEPVELPVEVDARGLAESEWAIPKDAKLGRYQVTLVRAALGPEARERVLDSGSFRVEEFRVPLLAGALQPPARPLVDVREFPLDVALRYLAGGPARGLDVTLRTQLRPRAVSAPEAFEGFAFLAGSVREGVERSSTGADAETPPAAPEVETQTLTLDGAGSARASVAGLPASESPSEVVAELAFRDPNGETQTLSSTVPLWPADRMIGMRVAPLLRGEALRVETVVLDLAKKPRWRAPVRVELFERKTYSHRQRMVGGFYAYQHATETRSRGTLCEGRTDWDGRFSCEATPTVTGRLILRASTRDGEGRVAATHAERFRPGEDDFWFDAESSDRMDVVPERPRYEPGEVAFLQVRMPFREASALVTVEREGVAEAFVTRLSGREPIVKLQVREAHAPNVFVSVLAVRGRVGEPEATPLVDLARPAVKLGMTKLRVGWRAHELDVSVKPAQEAWRVRETAKLRVRVRTPDGDLPPPGSELAVAAVDEGLLELAPNASWRLLEAMEDERSQEVRTCTAQLQVVGRRHFGQKAVPSGGGGGGRPTRELFDTLLAWRPRVALDAQGEASLEIPLNDSLTSFRVVAIATGGVDRFGTGSAKVRTTQELMVLPGVPPLAREGDRLRPEFTVRNAGDDTLAVDATLRVEGLGRELAPQRLTLAPGEARALGFEIEVPVGVSSLAYELSARTGPDGPEDRVRLVERVVPAVPERVFQATLLRLDGPAALPVERPSDALPGRGAIALSLRPSLANGTDGLERFFAGYPYSCLEQKVSAAIGLRDPGRWSAIGSELPAHLDEDGLAKFFPRMRSGSDVLTSYLLSISDEAGFALPEPSRERMLDALEAFVDGRIARTSWWPVADLPLRKLAALDALARHGRDAGARLAAVPRQPELWPTSALLDQLSLLRRLPPEPARQREIERAERLLRARLTLGGTTLGFSTERADGMDWMLASAETNLNRFVLLAHVSPGFRTDLPRLVKGALGRQRRGAWSTTVANAWGRLALERFAAEFEATTVAGETSWALDGEAGAVAWDTHDPARALRLPWPLGPGEVTLRHTGAGAPWAEVQSIAAIPLRAPLLAGYTIARRWEAVEQRTAGRWTRGDVVRVRIEVEAQSDAAWVVVADPIPTGATLLGSGLGRDSALATEGERSEGDGWWCPCRAFTERSFEAHRDYFEYVPKGKLGVEYTMRLNQDGRFELPPTRVEAMYAPESFAELPHETLEVAP